MEQAYEKGYMKTFYFLIFMFAGLSVEGRIQILQTGSSTVYPFAVKVAQAFSKETTNVCPLVESTGTGAGFLDFSQADNNFGYDIAAASRKIKPEELKKCKKAGIASISEICIGIDGIALATKKNLKGFKDLSLQDIFSAISKTFTNKTGETIENPYKKWSDIDSKYPDAPIRILIPSKAHGTRDTFETVVMKGHAIRSGPEIREISDYEAADSHDLLFDFLKQNDTAMAFVAVSLLDAREDHIKALSIDSTEPTILNIQNSTYPLVRKLFIYVNERRYGKTEGLREYVNEWLNPAAIGKDGYLTKMGLIPLLATEKKQRKL